MNTQIFKLYLLNDNNSIINIHIYDYNADDLDLNNYFNEEEIKEFNSQKLILNYIK